MHKTGDKLNLSAGDLVGHLNCRYLTQLDPAVAHGRLCKDASMFTSGYCAAEAESTRESQEGL